jgi:hypothetical protein
MGTIFGREPAAIAAFLGIAINLAITFGLNLTVEQVALINALVVAGLALIVRQGSTSLVAPKLPQGTTVTVVTPEGQPNTTKTL